MQALCFHFDVEYEVMELNIQNSSIAKAVMFPNTEKSNEQKKTVTI